MFWFIIGILILLFLIDFILADIISNDIINELKKISIFKVKRIEKITHSYIMYIILFLFFLVMMEEIFFRLLPAMLFLAIFHSTFMLALGLIFTAFIDAYVHRINAEKLIPNIPENTLNIYFLWIFILQLVLAFAFYHIFMITLASSNVVSALLYAFIITTMIHFTYDLIDVMVVILYRKYYE